jgi:hypothetical protein
MDRISDDEERVSLPTNYSERLIRPSFCCASVKGNLNRACDRDSAAGHPLTPRFLVTVTGATLAEGVSADWPTNSIAYLRVAELSLNCLTSLAVRLPKLRGGAKTNETKCYFRVERRRMTAPAPSRGVYAWNFMS